MARLSALRPDAWWRYGAGFALLALGGVAYSQLQVTVWIFAAVAVATGLMAAAVHGRRPANRAQRIRRPPRPAPNRPPARPPSRAAIERHYLAVVAAEVRRLGRENRPITKSE